MDGFDTLRTQVPESVIALRLMCAVVLGAAIGLEREYKNREAGLRTHMLVSLAAAIFTIITFELFYKIQAAKSGTPADPIRIIEAVTAGVAFLAAGAIIQSRGEVQGLTTGAGMWLAGSIGVACGAGYLILALMAALFALFILIIVGKAQDMIKDNGPAQNRSQHKEADKAQTHQVG
jgi:putative Mg2+ transporter-C (MgtC) family protein